MQNFQNLNVWKKAHVLVLEIYKQTKNYPREETYGLTSQMRRAATSITANIAEGSCRKTDNDFAHFLQMALGSASELEYYFILSNDLGYISNPISRNLTHSVLEIKKMLISFIGKVRS